MTPNSSQTYTFVFTDIEGSTRLWEKSSEAMDHALESHDRYLDSTFRKYSGHIFKTVGDMFCVAFTDPGDAIEAVTEAQVHFHSHEYDGIGALKVRMAVYTGVARFRDDDYFGTALNRVSRLLSAGHGGQVLVSSATADIVRQGLPDPISLIDLGPHQLRDVEHPETIYQLVHPSLDVSFPVLRTLDAIPNNLPRQITSFVGRDSEVLDVSRLLREKSLITLIGSGGCGKTRLAVQVAGDLLQKFRNGVWFVDLAPVSDSTLVPAIAGSALGIAEEVGVSPMDALKKHLRGKNLLLILDNCEHLVEACAQMVNQVLQVAPEVKILATSREALGIPGEATWRVPNLSLPSDGDEDLADLLDSSEALRLFLERGRASNPDFDLNNDNVRSVAAICRRLDGIPLAIELAAARVKSLPVDQIAARLDDRFRLLTGGSRTALPRQQTLRALIDWSYNLLSQPEKQLLSRLAVFSGGWSLAACEKVCALEPLEEWEIVDLLAQLVDKSLVIFQNRAEGRYEFLETVRQYANEKLFDGDEGPELRNKHCDYYKELAAEGESKIGGSDQTRWLDLLHEEADNFRSALEWSFGDPEKSDQTLLFAKSLGRFWEIRGFFSEGAAFLDRAIQAAPETMEDLIMRALNQAGNIRLSQGDYEGARSRYLDSLALARKLGFQRGIAILLNNLGIVSQRLTEYNESEDYYVQSVQISRENAYDIDLCSSLTNLATVRVNAGKLDGVHEMILEAHQIARRLGDTRSMAICYYAEGEFEKAKENLEAAQSQLQRALSMMVDIGYKVGIIGAIEMIAGVRARELHPVESAKLFGFVSRYRERFGIGIAPNTRFDINRDLAKAQEALGSETYEHEFEAGRHLTLEAALRLSGVDTD
ncbi:MAG: tetratricopeptide repeat protein [Armatimonadetes bacterium]|nr:tetratricopeptide repeat protein [Armatimonadota bacterium]